MGSSWAISKLSLINKLKLIESLDEMVIWNGYYIYWINPNGRNLTFSFEGVYDMLLTFLRYFFVKCKISICSAVSCEDSGLFCRNE